VLSRPRTQFLALLLWGALLHSPAARGQSSGAPALSSATAPSKEIAKRARKLFSQAQQAERDEDWQAAFALYSEAAELLPGDGIYLMRRETARFRLVQEHMDRAERAGVTGSLEEARAELRAALAIDPSYTVAQERLQQFETPGRQRLVEPSYPSRPVEVKPLPGTRSFDHRGDTRRAYEEVARQFGLAAVFDEDLRPQQIRFRVQDVDFWTSMQLLGRLTSTFWRAIDEHAFLVAPDTPQKRKELEPSVVRAVTLSNLATPEQMTEMVRLVREIAGVRRTELDTRTRTLTMRDSPESIALAMKIIEDLGQSAGEMMLEVEILDVDRNAARQLGITPPTRARTFTVSPQDIRQARQSPEALLQVLQRVFGTPTTFTGQSSLGAFIPPLVAFGGGKSIFLATLPGAAAQFADTFSVVRQAQRLLLRAQDGQPATFFSGERFPVAVAVLQPNLVSPLAAAIGQASFPRSDLNTPEGPRSVVAADFNSDGRIDLAVASAAAATITSRNGAVRSANVVTITTTSAHGLSVNQPVVIAGVTDSSFDSNPNSTFVVATVPSATTFTYAQTGPDASSGGGTVSTMVTIASSNGAVRSANVVTISTSSAHGLSPGQTVTVSGVSDTSFDGSFVIATVASATTFTYAQTGSFASSGGGIVSTAANSVAIFLGNGDGTFGSRSDIPVGVSPISIAVADFNADGHPDLAVANEGSNSVSILLGAAAPIASAGAVRSAKVVTITTTSAHGLSPGQTVTVSGVSDSSFNGTFVVATVPSATTFTYAQTGPNASSGGGTVSTFTQGTDIATGTPPRAVIAGDFNGDGRVDLAVAHSGSNSIASNGVVRSANVVTIATTSAHGLSVGETVTISGVSDSSFNGTFVVATVPSATMFTYAQTGSNASSGGGTAASNIVSIFLGNGDGTFGQRTDLAAGANPRALATGNFRGGLSLNLAVANRDANTVSVFLGNGGGTFLAGIASSNGAVRRANVVTITTTSAHGLSVGQTVTISGVSDSSFNGTFVISTVPSATTFTYAQTGPDASSGSGTVSSGATFLAVIASSNGAVRSANVVTITTTSAHGLRAGQTVTVSGVSDTSFDGTFVISTVPSATTFAYVQTGPDASSGSGTVFTGSRTDYLTGSAPVAIAVADFNRDNQPDLAVANHDSNSVSILLGNGDGTFRARTDFAVGDGPAAVVTGDFDLDGTVDLITADSNANAVTVLLGTGDGSFGFRTDLNTGSGPAALAASDFNGDGRVDLAAADRDANTVSVILNQTPIVSPSAAATSLAATPYPGFQYEDLGVKVRATPRLHPNGEVTLQLQLELRSLSGQAINGIPILSNRTVEETVRLRENETTLLTGILGRTRQLAISGWPGFASTPGLGVLTTSRDLQQRETELLIFITPRRIRLAPRLERSIYTGLGREGERSGAVARPPRQP